MLSVGLRWPLWKDHLTPKGAATHKVENCCLGASRFLLHSFWYCTTVSGYSFHFYIEKQALGSPMVSPASLPWVALTSSGSNHPKNWGCYRREGSGFTHLHPFLSQSSFVSDAREHGSASASHSSKGMMEGSKHGLRDHVNRTERPASSEACRSHLPPTSTEECISLCFAAESCPDLAAAEMIGTT